MVIILNLGKYIKYSWEYVIVNYTDMYPTCILLSLETELRYGSYLQKYSVIDCINFLCCDTVTCYIDRGTYCWWPPPQLYIYLYFNKLLIQLHQEIFHALK